jgi:hypothetical protein
LRRTWDARNLNAVECFVQCESPKEESMSGEPWVLQDWVTIRKESAPSTFVPVVVQHAQRVMSAAGYNTVEVQVSVLSITSGVTLSLETTSDERLRTWRATRSLTSAAQTTTMLRRELGRTTDFLEDFLRWRISYTGGTDWQVCFRIIAVPRN